jgi:hypothetical protein
MTARLPQPRTMPVGKAGNDQSVGAGSGDAERAWQ